MASRRTRHRTVAVDVDAPTQQQPRRFPWPWYTAAVGGPVAVLAVGWLILAALATVGWLTSPQAALPDALRLATRMLVLAHGGPVQIGSQAVSLAPLGVTLLMVFLAIPVASFAARQRAADAGDPDDTGALWVDGESIVWRVGAVFAGSYTVVVVAVAGLVGALSVRAVIGAAAVGVVAGGWGAARGVGFDPTSGWPRWVRVLPRAMAAALLAVLAGSSMMLALAMWSGRERVTELVSGLDGGGAGVFLLVALHLMYLPNLVLGCAAWALGAGLSLGDGSLITMAGTDAGLLPAIPAFGALPLAGGSFWWLLLGAAAGLIAGVVVALGRPRARFDETSLVGGLAGVAAGLVVCLAAALGSGGLGSGRLAHVGARFPELLIYAPTILGLAGMVGGLVTGLLRRPPRPDGVG